MKRRFPALLAAVCAFAADVTTYHNDNARTGQNLNETILTPANVSVGTFGKLFVIATDGKVDAQPLYLSVVNFPGQGTHNALYVATEHNTVYAVDADTGTRIWSSSMLMPGEVTSEALGCGQVEPEIGITATPVIAGDIGPNGTIYVVAMSKDSSGSYHQRLHALDVTTGAEEFSGPQEVQATYPGHGDNSNGSVVVFDPMQYKERAALLLLNGVLYTSWASHCDGAPYTGWVIGYQAATLAQTSVFNFTPNGSRGSVWMSGAGPAADAAGNIYFLAANGTFDTTLNAGGFPSSGDYGNAFMQLSTVQNNLAVTDYFTMANAVVENDADEDLGSGGALVLPDMTDSNGATRHLAVGAGKDEHIYLVDRDNMGKFSPEVDTNYQDLPGAISGGVFGMPAYFNGCLYYGGAGDLMKAFQFSNARLVTQPAWMSSTWFGYPGPTPDVSANGTDNGIVWAVESADTAVLHAYDPQLNELYNSSQAANARDEFGGGNKFMTPTIVNGKVYVGTPDGVAVFGLLQTNSRRRRSPGR